MELIELLKTLFSNEPTTKWIKSKDVRKILDLCPGTLQTLRNSNKIEFTKIGRTIYYNEKAIHKMLEERNNLNGRK
ncbi:helix-turn-helix domain-containing protein [Sphingobacterium multivorum]|uniref:Helix-turn-helix domain-containing protein n=1 Tax=Sphingobacterium multivorum TaxID=28454 RepID=A0ABX7CW50_SPHMU|nr:helix-turn-helix domain-containing protein [Sphingobacterium multivorum]